MSLFTAQYHHSLHRLPTSHPAEPATFDKKLEMFPKLLNQDGVNWSFPHNISLVTQLNPMLRVSATYGLRVIKGFGKELRKFARHILCRFPPFCIVVSRQ